ncbi:D-glycerate dehydrogenase [Alkalihalophilus pseudofirmus]|uniref:Glyoxylate/hydroxypyruvate reductase B n=1 Tax=Alkalihalophilus pseudofirmus TaxID=79885 RepID=A0AAJ2NPA2_ALKPS|nr:D-glycerate dehydrogenase [Alkalihalophilus pseudofirmus]MDV2886041.1 D-glycerate dehydrogenase [Alkalihalophilus pseudofirmus]
MKVVVTRKFPDSIINPLRDKYEVVMWEYEDKVMPRDLLLQESKDADALLVNLTDDINDELYEQSPKLKVVSTMAVGYDNIDVAGAIERGIKVGHTPNVLTDATADLTFALILASGRRLLEAADVIRRDEWKSWAPFYLTGQEVSHKTIGIIGMGRIGEAVAKRAQGFSMNILYHNRSRKREAEETLHASYVTFDELLERSDYVVLLAPSTPETKKMMGHEQFAKMKKSAVFINTSRGTNVDEEALYEALKTNEIYAAGLDVFDQEPISADHPLLKLPNVTAMPHIGSAALETRMKMAQMARDHIIEGLEGRDLTHEVN